MQAHQASTALLVETVTKGSRSRTSEDEDEDEDDYKGSKRVRLAERRSFQKVPEYSGAPEGYDNWRFRFRGALSCEGEMINMLDWVEAKAVDMGKDAISSITEATPRDVLSFTYVGTDDVDEDWHTASTTTSKAVTKIHQLSEELYARVRINIQCFFQAMLRNLEDFGSV